MPKFAAAVVLFSVGFIFAVLVFFIDNYATESSTKLDTKSKVVLSSKALKKGLSSSLLQQGVYEDSTRHEIQRLVEVLTFAIDEGTLDSLQLIRSDSLRTIPSYRSVVLPELKRESLNELIDRFEQSDWENWPYAAYANKKGPSSARQFVDDVVVINPELGRFLETSAQLLYELYSSVQSGVGFEVDQVLKQLIEDADSLALVGQKGTNLVLDAYDLSVADDPIFRVGLEKTRCDLTLDYIKRFPDNISEHLSLIKSLQPRYCSSKLVSYIENILARLSLDGSRGFRSQVLLDNSLMSVIEEVSTAHLKLRPVIASFYLVGALDAMEAGALDKSEEFVNLSTHFVPNLREQVSLRSAIAHARNSSNVAPNPDYIKYYVHYYQYSLKKVIEKDFLK